MPQVLDLILRRIPILKRKCINKCFNEGKEGSQNKCLDCFCLIRVKVSLIANPVCLQKLEFTWKNGDLSQTLGVASCKVLLEQQLIPCCGTITRARAWELVPMTSGFSISGSLGATCQGTRCHGAGTHSQELTSPLLKWVCSVTFSEDLFMCQEHPVTFVLIPMTSSGSHCRILWADLSKSRENKRFFGTSEDCWLSVPECRVMVWKRPRTPYLALKGFQYTETHFFQMCSYKPC